MHRLAFVPPPPVVPPPPARPPFDVKLVRNGQGWHFVTCFPMVYGVFKDLQWPTFCHTTKHYDRVAEVVLSPESKHDA